jgi:diguanylate cyclase (GGDEF)-like protein
MNRPLSTTPRPAEPMTGACAIRMGEAVGSAEVARIFIEWAGQRCGCRCALVTWSGRGAEVLASTLATAPDLDLLLRLAALPPDAEAWRLAGDGLYATRASQAPVVMLLQADAPPSAERLAALVPSLRLAATNIMRLAELASLRDSHLQLERSENLQRALFAISDLAGSDLDMPRMLRGIHAIVSTLMYAENFFIVRYDEERDSLRFLYFADVADTDGPDISADIPMESRRHTMTWHLITGGRALMGSTEELQDQVDGPTVMLGPDSVDWLGVPMLRDGRVYGGLVVQSYREGVRFSAEDRALLEFVGSHILTALERKQSKDELEQQVRLRTIELAEANRGLQQEVLERQRAERLQAVLFHIAQLATADIDEGEFYERLHQVVGELLNAENFFIALLTDDRRILEFPYYVDAGARRIVSREVGRGLSEYVLRSGEPLLGGRERINDLARGGEIDAARIGRPAECWLGVPLRVGDEVIGLVVVQSYSTSVSYGAADQELLGFAAMQIANSIHRRRSAVSLQRAYAGLERRVEERTQELREQILRREQMQQQLQHQVMHDALTGLPNRRFLRERLDGVLARIEREPWRRCALLYLDVDRFKVINDSLGHLAGDELLREIAVRLQRCVHVPDMVARLSGDEFAVLLEEVDGAEAVHALASRMLDVLAWPLQAAGRELEPSVSIGIAIGDASYRAGDDLLRDADLALYRAKDLGRKRCAMFDETLARSAVDVLAMEGELRRALQQGEFLPHFQPISRLDSGEVVGHEALLRWNHPRRGLLVPGEFMRVAQESGHIEAIDWQLFESACVLALRKSPLDTFLTLNVSALHLRHADFDQRLLRLLEQVGFAPSRLVIEVTEGSLLDDPDRVRATLERLRTMGVGAALDDFGTGYSSLSYLHSLPLRMLKIDRAFVHALDEGTRATTTVVAAILALARALDIRVIAEGIETPEQKAALMRMGCEFGQGYLLGRPAPFAPAGLQGSGGVAAGAPGRAVQQAANDLADRRIG